MDQVSRPMLIALAATVVLAAVWFVAMRPKPAEVADTPAAPVTAIAPVKDAAAKAEAANDRIAAAADRAGATTTPGSTTTPSAAAKPATTTTTTTPATPATTIPAKPATKSAPAKAATRSPAQIVAAAGRREERAVSRDIRRGKVVVLMFWNGKSADDIATRATVRGLSRHGGKVAVHVVRISHVGQFDSITRGVTVNQSPVTLVIDRKRRTRAILGLTESVELSQAVDDALARGR
jgi:hypothetical protein